MNKRQRDKLMVHNAVERVSQLLGNVSTEQIYSKERTYPVAVARQLVYWYLFRVCKMTYSDIGRMMGRTHASILYGVRQMEITFELNRDYDHKLREAAEELKKTGVMDYETAEI